MRWPAIATVLAACYRGGPEPQPPPPPPTALAPPTATSEAEATFATPPQVLATGQPNAASCSKDEIFETVCGMVTPRPTPGATCAASGDQLQSFGRTRVVITSTSGMANDPALRDFVLDDAATASWQADVRHKGLAITDGYCCYSRCSPIGVVASAPAVVAPPGYRLDERCMPPPAAGTTVPAANDPACPAAVTTYGKPSPYLGPQSRPRWNRQWWFQGQTCCYASLVRERPPNMGHCPTCKCAARGTLVATPTGERAIESLAAGELVLSLHRGRVQSVPLARVSRTAARDHVIVHANLDTGRTVAMSPQHPTADGSRFVDLAFGARLGDATVITTVHVPYDGGFTFDILPASDSGTYVANGALVGSTLAP